MMVTTSCGRDGVSLSIANRRLKDECEAAHQRLEPCPRLRLRSSHRRRRVIVVRHVCCYAVPGSRSPSDE